MQRFATLTPFGTLVPPTSVRVDLDADGSITTIDVFKVLTVFGFVCT